MNRLLTTAVAAAALWAAACGGGGGSSVQPPPPAGNFSPASLNGTYAFTTSGEVFTSNALTATPLARVGSFVADGKGGITGGVEDVNSAGTPSGAVSITGGSYTLTKDGRGALILNFETGNSINFAFVLTSGSNGSSPAKDGLMIDETSTTSQSSTGSGNFVLQDPAVCSSPVTSVAGTYIFDFAGLDSSGSPESFVGEFTANNGVTTANFGDLNDDFTLSNGSFVASLASANLPPAGPTACGRGQALIAGQTYAFYVVNSTRVRFINSAGGEMLSGDAVLQTSVPTNLNSGFAFIVAGSSGNGGLTRVGRLTANGAAVSNVLLDTNNAGAFTPTNGATNASITLDQANPGRGTITFVGQGLSTTTPFSFVFYLTSATSGVIQETTHNINTNVVAAVADGSIVAQTGSPFASSNITGLYALNWSGLSVQQGSLAIQDEEDLLALASITSLSLSGTADIFQFTNGVPRTDFGLGGKITLGGDGTGSGGLRNMMTINLNGASPINFVVYIASPQLAFFANSNNSGTQRVVAGILKTQQ
jgi:hypothetical protein